MKENLIGKEIFFDHAGSVVAASILNRNLIPAIKEAISEYQALEVLPPFTQDVFKQWIATNGKSVTDAYLDIAKKDAAKFKISALKEMAMQAGKEDVKYFIKAWQAVTNNLSVETPTSIIYFDFDTITFGEDLQPFLNIKAVESKYRLLIETEQQAAFYAKAKEAEKVLLELHQILGDGGYDMTKFFWTTESFRNGVFDIAANGVLKFNVENVKYLKTTEKLQENEV